MLTPEEKQARKNSLGGSDAAPAVGISPWKTPYELWAEKTGLVEQDDISDLDAVWWGSQLESLIRLRAEDQFGITVRGSHQMIRNEKYPWMHANIDGKVQGKRQGVEIKTTSSRSLDEWGEQGTDQIPLHYLMQVVHYQVVTGMDKLPWIVLLLINGRELRQYEVPFNKELAEKLIEKEHEFWQRVETKEAPLITAKDVSLAWAQDNGQAVLADDEIVGTHSDLIAIKQQIKTLEAEKQTLETTIKFYMQDNADLLISPEGATLATWRTPKASEVFDTKQFKIEHPDLYEKFLTARTPTRRFLAKEVK